MHLVFPENLLETPVRHLGRYLTGILAADIEDPSADHVVGDDAGTRRLEVALGAEILVDGEDLHVAED